MSLISDKKKKLNISKKVAIKGRFLLLEKKGGQESVQCTLRKACTGCDWQRHYSLLGTLPFRDYNDVTLIPLHG